MSVSGIIDQSENLTLVPVTRDGTLTIEQDAGTPLGDPVDVTIKGLALNFGSTLNVDNGATATIVNLFDPTAKSTIQIGSGATVNLEDHNAKRFASVFSLSGANGTLNIGADVKISPNNFISDSSGTNTIELLGTTAAYGKWFQFPDFDGGSLHLYDSSHHYLRSLYFTGTHTAQDFTVTDDATGTAIAEVANDGIVSGHSVQHHASDTTGALYSHAY